MSDIWEESKTVGAYREITPDRLGKVPDLRMVDVREPDEFVGELGHIPGSELVPLGTVLEAAQAWDPNETILLVCRSGNRSGQAAAVLAQRGHTRLINLQGGMLAYSRTGLPVE